MCAHPHNNHDCRYNPDYWEKPRQNRLQHRPRQSTSGLVNLIAKPTLTRVISTSRPLALGKGDIVAGSGKKGVSVVVAETEAEVGRNDVVEDGDSDDSDIFTFKR